MRKKSLRAMKSAVFQAPESREEAIMQNILGASNVLEPSESNIEEILKSILYNTPYTKEAEFEIEKILLAIKNNGTYDGEGESRDVEILISKLNQTPYTKDAESRIEELFILWAEQSIVKQLEGVPPLAFTAQGQPLINWTIYGASGGVGNKTANLLDVNGSYSYKHSSVSAANNELYINPVGAGAVSRIYYSTEYVAGTYTISANKSGNIGEIRLFSPIDFEGSTYNAYYGGYFKAIPSNGLTVTFSTPFTIGIIAGRLEEDVSSDGSVYNLTLNIGSTAKPYEPWGNKIPISCGGETNTIYLDTPLYDGNSISMADTGIEIPTTNGQNTLAVDTTVQPEKVYIEYK